MPSRRRSRNKNLGNNLADVQRRLRNMERRPVRTKLQNRVVTTASIAVNAVTPDEVSFGTTVITSDPVNTIENPKDGLLVINETAGTTSVYSEEQRDYIQLPAVDDDARTVANGKNTIYYQNSAPSGGTYAVDDTWFDSDDGYKMYTWTGTTWSGFQLGNSAIASISAQKITAGSLAADVIVSSNISAGQINAGSLNSGVVVTSSLNANLITTGTITGVTFQTTGTGRKIQLTNQDDLLIFNDDSTKVGLITSVDTNWDFSDEKGSVFIEKGMMIYGGQGTPAQGGAITPAIVLSNDVISIFGGTTAYMEYDSSSTRTYGEFSLNQADIISLNSGYAPTPGDWYVEISGPLVFARNQNNGPLSEGSGQPPASGHTFGQIVFRYT